MVCKNECSHCMVLEHEYLRTYNFVVCALAYFDIPQQNACNAGLLFSCSRFSLMNCGICSIYSTIHTYIYIYIYIISSLGKKFQTFNVHQLLHFSKVVEDLGPFWSNSCFPFEDYNGDLRDLFHGTQNVDGQVSILYSMYVTACCAVAFAPNVEETSVTRVYPWVRG